MAGTDLTTASVYAMVHLVGSTVKKGTVVIMAGVVSIYFIAIVLLSTGDFIEKGSLQRSRISTEK